MPPIDSFNGPAWNMIHLWCHLPCEPIIILMQDSELRRKGACWKVFFPCLLIMVREKDVCWEYAEKLEGNKVKCKFCLKVLNGGISRLKHHLSRLPSKGVHPCGKVRDDVTDKVRAIIAMKEEGKEASSARKLRLAEARSPGSVSASKALMSMEATSPLTKLFTPTPPALPQPSFDRENAERSIALFFFENKLDLSLARSSSYQLMMDAVAKCGQGFRGPSSDTLKTTWLQRVKSEVTQQSRDIEKEWATTGCTIIADTWPDNKSRGIINFLVSSPSGTFFHKSVDASACFNAKNLSDLFDSVIQDFGPENVVQVIVDNASNYVGVRNHIMQNYGTIFWSPCASHCLSLILEDFSKIDWVSRYILKAQTISRFIYNHMWVLDLMRKFLGGQELICTSISKSASNFLSLRSMWKQKLRLRHMFNSPEYSSSHYANKAQSITCIDIVEDNDFWRAVEEITAVSEPLLKLLSDVVGGKPAVGSIYDSMTRVMESIRTYYIMDENKCKAFLDIVDRRWHNQLHSRLHSAAAFLNPSIQYNQDIKYLGMIKEDFLNVLEKLLPIPELRQDMTGQIVAFQKAQGMFGCSLARESRNTTAPGIWWEQYGDSAPGLQRVAVRILSQVCSSPTLERNWSAFQQTHSEKRNKLDKETLNDLLYVNFNLKLAARAKAKPTDIDAIITDDIDMTSEWAEEFENSNTSPTPWRDQFSSALDGVS
ncbi:hypothetical protein AAC387_Pa12g1801 [Persea americana]